MSSTGHPSRAERLRRVLRGVGAFLVVGGVVHTAGISAAALAGGLSSGGWRYVAFLVTLGVVQVSVGLIDRRAGALLDEAPAAAVRLVGVAAGLALVAGAAAWMVAVEAPLLFRAVGPAAGLAQLGLAAWTWSGGRGG